MVERLYLVPRIKDPENTGWMDQKYESKIILAFNYYTLDFKTHGSIPIKILKFIISDLGVVHKS